MSLRTASCAELLKLIVILTFFDVAPESAECFAQVDSSQDFRRASVPIFRYVSLEWVPRADSLRFVHLQSTVHPITAFLFIILMSTHPGTGGRNEAGKNVYRKVVW